MKIQLNAKNFDENLKSGLKIVEFYASWCRYCMQQEIVLEEMDKIWIGQVDSDRNPELIKRFNIKGFPSFIIFDDGIAVEHFSGFRSKFELMDILTKYINKERQIIQDVEANEDF